MKNRVQYGVVSAEISHDFQRVADVAGELGIRYIDINIVNRQQVTELCDETVDDIALALKTHNLRAHMITGPTFKNTAVAEYTPEAFIQSPEFAADMDGLRRGFAIAKKLGTPFVRVFSFARTAPGPIPEDRLAVIQKALQTAADEAKTHGITLLLENVRGCWANTGKNSAEILRAVGADNVKMAWDPANAYVAGETSNELLLAGMKAVTPYIAHFHIKDARVHDNRRPGRGRQTGTDSQGHDFLFDWVCIGEGDVDVKGQLEALFAMHYEGVVTLETHWIPEGGSPEQGTRASFARLVEKVKSTHRS